MPNFYVGQDRAHNVNNNNITLRSGYNKHIVGNAALNGQMGHNDVTTGQPNTVGNNFGAFTGCGGLVVRTENEVYIAHSSPGANMLVQQWNNQNNWLCQRRDFITHAVFINFGSNVNPLIFNTIREYLQGLEQPPIIHTIGRNDNTAVRASANINGVFVMAQISYNNPILNVEWGQLQAN